MHINIGIPIACEEHEFIAIRREFRAGVWIVSGLRCLDCDRIFTAEEYP